MTPKTPLQWLAAKVETGPFPENGNRRQQTAWFRARRHNLKIDIGASTYELRKCKEHDELYATLIDIKRQGSVALRTLETLIRLKPLKDFKRSLHRFETHYDTLGASVGHAFMILAEDLAGRAGKVR